METVSLVSSVVVCCPVAEGDASSIAGVEGMCASTAEGTCTSRMMLIMSVCCAVVFLSFVSIVTIVKWVHWAMTCLMLRVRYLTVQERG